MSASMRQPFPLLEIMPPVLNDVVLDFVWDQQKLWSLHLPVTQVSVAELEWHLDLPMWSLNGRPFVLTPKEVAQDPERFRDQYARTLAADTRFPLHLLVRPNRLTVLDGLHRLLKAGIEGRKTVLVKMVPPARLDDIAKVRTRS
ncbi:hypothetical protein M1L60_46105 [Actinoplanes sp. TRM 88003]|uniref:Uncharacterized protein n=1 Tax=Paractinoplanes aksuensis TaxID=2939490 RepID=A0ABT1E6U5_9ACTN|nr:hypothetical protein [Actinoplanes aksuensis]MCO8277971.1 hypothetical protein [Actinoplanes aksuensis]